MPLRVVNSSKACLVFNIFSGDPQVDALTIGLYQVCIIINQPIGEGEI